MARRESIAVAGYFPTPPDVVRRLCLMLAPPVEVERTNSYTSVPVSVVFDPCAGEGAALHAVTKRLRARSYAVEMEATRANTLRRGGEVLHGDFFHLEASPEFVDLLWLNPPYDTDRETGRLEERFLRRASGYLVIGGILVFIVPGYALAASAATLATGYTDLQCFRFPDESYGQYKQVVLFARRSPRPAADTTVEAQVRAWAANPGALPVLEENPTPTILVPTSNHRAETWRMSTIDVTMIRASFHPWVSDRGEIRDICPLIDLASRYNRTYPVASTPRASHLAAALAAGVFNGARVEPNETAANLPPLLVKGVFDREYRTVEEKHNSDGDKVAEVQVQHPVLQVTVLDLREGTFHTIRPSAELPMVTEVKDMTLANLLDLYGESLMQAMRNACPVLHDPRRDPEVEITTLAQPLYPAQKTVVNTLLKLHKGGAIGAIVLGEIGSGKTRVALATSAELGMRRTLVMCPPHLLDSWKDQIAAVLPGRKVIVLDTLTDADRFATSEEPIIGILSREKAKLGHGWKGLTGSCPKCGAAVDKRDLAIKREVCSNVHYKPSNALAAWVLRHATEIALLQPNHTIANTFVASTAHGERIIHRAKMMLAEEPPPQWSVPDDIARELLSIPELPKDIRQWLAWSCPSLAIEVAQLPSIPEWDWNSTKMAIALAVPPETTFERWPTVSLYGAGTIEWSVWEKHHAFVHGLPGGAESYQWKDYTRGCYSSAPWGSRQAFSRLLDVVLARSLFRSTRCGEPLYQAVPEPRRYPIASWICHRHRDAADMLVIDEVHEFSAEDSAQSHAKERLEQGHAFRLLLTGSFINGYADSAFNNIYAVSPDVRAEFGRDGRTQFVDRYGYWKRIVQEKDAKGKVVAFGSNSDRVQRTTKKAGMAPGMLPLFNLERLLPVAATLQKTDLQLDLPQPVHTTSPVVMTDDQAQNYKYLLRTLLEEIKKTRHTAGLAGKLWGALSHLAGYPDLACCGEYEVRWPENVPVVGGQVIASVPGLDPSIRLPKEEWMVNTVRAEVADGRPVLVLAWHRALLPRLLNILTKEGFDDAIYLDAAQVPTAKRQAWIDRQVVKPGRRVMVVNPVAIQTGLNNLVHFKTQLWMENPECNPNTFRQAQGRIDRVGQTQTPCFNFVFYDESLQVQAHKLLLHKVGVALGVDGLDPEAALRAAGVADDGFLGLSVGRALYRMITGE